MQALTGLFLRMQGQLVCIGWRALSHVLGKTQRYAP